MAASIHPNTDKKTLNQYLCALKFQNGGKISCYCFIPPSSTHIKALFFLLWGTNTCDLQHHHLAYVSVQERVHPASGSSVNPEHSCHRLLGLTPIEGHLSHNLVCKRQKDNSVSSKCWLSEASCLVYGVLFVCFNTSSQPAPTCYNHFQKCVRWTYFTGSNLEHPAKNFPSSGGKLEVSPADPQVKMTPPQFA